MNDSEDDGSWCTTSFEEDVYKLETNQQIRVIRSKTTTHFNNNNEIVDSPNETNEIITVRKISSSRLLTQRVSSECTSIQNAKRTNTLKSTIREPKRTSIKIQNNEKSRWSSPIRNRTSKNIPKPLLFPNRSASSSLEEDEKKLQFVKNIKQYCLDLVDKDRNSTEDKSVIKKRTVKSNYCRHIDEKTSTYDQKDISIQTPQSLCGKSSKEISLPSSGSLRENYSGNEINEQQTYEQLLISLKAAQANVVQEILHKWKNVPAGKENENNDKIYIEENTTKIVPNLQLPESSSSSFNSEKENENYESSGRGNSVDLIAFNNLNNQTMSANKAEHAARKKFGFPAQYSIRSIQNESPSHNSKTPKMEQPQKEIQQFSLLPTSEQQLKVTHQPSKDDDFVQELKENNTLLSKVIKEQQALRESEGNLYSNLLNTVAKNLKGSDSSTDPTTRNVPINEPKTQPTLSIQSLPINKSKSAPSYSKLSYLPQTNSQKCQGQKSTMKYTKFQNDSSSQNLQRRENFRSLNKKAPPRYVIKKPKSKFSSHVHFNSLNPTTSTSYENSHLLYNKCDRKLKPVRKLKRKTNTTDIPSNESENLFKLRQNYRRQTLSENDEILPQWMISYALSNSKHSLYIPEPNGECLEKASIATQTLLSQNKYPTNANISPTTSWNVEAVSPNRLLIEQIVFDISKLNNQSLLFRIQELENEKRCIEEQFLACLQREKVLNERLDDLFKVKQNLKEHWVNNPDVSSGSKEKTYFHSPTANSSSGNDPKRKNKIRKSNTGLKIEIRQLKQRILKLKKQYNKNKQQRYHPIKYEYHTAEQYKSTVPHFNKYPTSSNCFVTPEPQNMQSILSPSSQKYDNGHLLENRNVEHHMIKQSNPVLNDNKPNKEVSNTKIHELNTRLKQTTQQVIDQCKLIKELKKNLEEQNGIIDNLKFRLSRSESVCHNKQLLLEAYKSKLTNAISTNELNQSLKSQASRQCNIITNEMRVLEDNLKAMREREGELMKLVNQLGKDKNRLIEEINKKNSFTMEELQKQIENALSERQEELTRQIRMNTKLNDLNNSANERLKKYEIGIEEFLWMVEDHLYQKYGDHDPVRKAHEMACSILHLTPTELREMFQDCHVDYNTKAPRMLDSWLTEYRKVTSNCDDDFPQKLAHFLYNICFSNKNNNNQSPNTSSKKN